MSREDLSGIRWMSVDYARNELRIGTDDGRVAIHAGVSAVDGPLDFETATFRVADLTLELVVPSGEILEVDVFANDDQMLRRMGRSVVYLDQNKWVQIAQAIHRPELVPPNELDPTLRIVERARDRQVILPISSSHWIETGPLEGHRRAHLATLMVGLSRGWVMRDPLTVARSELATVFTDDPVETTAAADAVFTLEGRALFAEPPPRYAPRGGSSLPASLVELIQTLSSVQSILAVLLEDERTQDSDGIAVSRKWAELHQTFSAKSARRQLSVEDRRRETLEVFIWDLGHELSDVARASGLGTEDLQRWVSDRAEQDLSRLPYLGRRREVAHARLSDPRDRWHYHDLIDMIYLPCAAEYADYLVCEKKTAHYLQRTGRGRPGSGEVVTSFGQLLDALD